jgi:hypothetical protein
MSTPQSRRDRKDQCQRLKRKWNVRFNPGSKQRQFLSDSRDAAVHVHIRGERVGKTRLVLIGLDAESGLVID